MNNLSIRTKILITVIGIIILAGAVIVFFIQTALSGSFTVKLKERAVVIAKNLAENSANLILTEDRVALQLLINNSKRSDGEIEYIYILDSRKRVLAHTFGSAFPADFRGVNILNPQQAYGIQPLMINNRVVFDIAAPILKGTIGVLHLGVLRQYIQDEITDIIKTVVLIVVLTLILGGLAVIIITTLLIKPIFELAAAAEEISKGNLGQKVNIRSRDEMGRLGIVFNKMIDDLSTMRSELIVARDYADSIISNMADALLVVDSEGIIKMVNGATLDLLGYHKNELIGQPLEKLFLQEEERERERYFQKIIVDGAAYNIGSTFLAKDGKRIPVNFSGSVMPGSGDIVIAVKDMTVIMRFVNDLQAKDQDLQEAMNVRLKFISMVSHELRTPLAAIKEGISVVLEGLTGQINEEQLRYLSIAKDNVSRLNRLITAVLDLQKFGVGKMVLRIENNDINAVIKEAHIAMLPLFEKKGLFLRLELGEGVPQVKFDKDKIIQVLTNLISNAFNFTERGGVVVSTLRENNFVRVAVTDTGTGIEGENMEKLFLEFVQLKRRAGGTGLGLSICKKIIEAHQGKIWAESELGKGSAFYFILPV